MSRPNSAASCASARARSSWASDRATTTVPPSAMSASMPSAAATRPTSATESRIAAYCAIAASRPASAASRSIGTGNSAEHQPPLRPDAPKPAISASTSTIRSSGSSCCR